MKFLIQLNGKTIEDASNISLAEAIFQTFSDQWHHSKFFSVKMTRKQWEDFQCKRLNIESLSGELTLIVKGEKQPLKAVELKPILEVAFHSAEPGFCRTYYKPVDKSDKRLLCVQEDFPDDFVAYECTSSGEPDHPINRKLLMIDRA